MIKSNDMYLKLGISQKVLDFSENILSSLEERFKEIDRVAAIAEYNGTNLPALPVTATTTLEERLSKRFMPTVLTPKRLLCVLRLPAELMHLLLH